MANAILNFHFDYLHTSLILTLYSSSILNIQEYTIHIYLHLSTTSQMEASVNEIAVNFDLAIPLDRSTSSTKEVSSKTKNDNDNKFTCDVIFEHDS